MKQTLLTLAAVAAFSFTQGCQPPAENAEDVDTSTVVVPVDVDDSNTTTGTETPDSNLTTGVEVPETITDVETPEADAVEADVPEADAAEADVVEDPDVVETEEE